MNISHLRDIRENLRRRAELFSSIRRFFDASGFLDVETNLIIDAPVPEEFIESIVADKGFLRASPEIAMKIMLAAGFEQIYQIGRCFRADEHGRRHRKEFTMLEFYSANMDYRELATFTANFIRQAAQDIFGKSELTYLNCKLDLECEPEWLTVKKAFELYSDISMEEAHKLDLFDEIMVTKIEPKLGRERLTILADYPAERASLARLKADDKSVAERWELYICGLELANSYGELIDPVEQRHRFEVSREFRRSQNMLDYPIPEDFFEAMNSGMPQCSGGALGLDRLAMVFCDTSDIAMVRCE